MKNSIWFLIFTFIVTIIYADPSKVTLFKSLGFSMETPNTWSDVTTEEFKDNIQQIHLGSSTLTKLLHENPEIPIYSIRKGNSELDEHLPIINVKLQKNNLDFTNISVSVRKILFPLSMHLKHSDYLIEPKTVRINGNLAGFSVFSYSIFDENEVETKVTSAIWIFPQKDYFYLVGSGFPSENFEPILEEVKSIVGTVKIGLK